MSEISASKHGFQCFDIAFSALTLLVGRQEVHPANKKIGVMRCWHGYRYLSAARCKWFAYGPADATATDNLQNTTVFTGSVVRDHPGEPVPEENFWTLWCKGRLTEADTPTIRLGSTPSILSSAHLHHPPSWLKMIKTCTVLQRAAVMQCLRQWLLPSTRATADAARPEMNHSCIIVDWISTLMDT